MSIGVRCFLSVSKRKTKLEHELRKALVGTLSKYGLVSNVREPSQNQKFIVLLLSKPDYDFRNHTDYELVSSLLHFCCCGHCFLIKYWLSVTCTLGIQSVPIKTCK